MDQVTLIATAAFGLESVVAREVKQLGYENVAVEDGRVTVTAGVEAIPRLNLWLRSANRVLVQTGRFPASDFGELFDRAHALPWEEWIPRDGCFPVRGRSVKSQLHSVPDCQRIVKKAIVERLKRRHGGEWFEETGPEFAVEVALLKDTATLTLDTTGPSLNRRGYRRESHAAPLKETLAAALVQLSFWNRDRPLLDPFCGTGTIPIEAALLGRNLAPGRHREFAGERWNRIPSRAWSDARAEAADLIQPPFGEPLRGSDVDSRAVEHARENADRAGVGLDVLFTTQPLAKVASHRKYGCVIGNPPYGERMGEADEAEALYREMGRVLTKLEGWSIYVLTPHPRFEELFGRPSDRRRKLYNGRIACTLHQYLGPPPPWQRGGRSKQRAD